MAVTYTTVEIWVLVDDAGQYVAHEDEAELSEAFEGRIGSLADTGGVRRVKLVVKVPLPTVIELEGEVTVEETERRA